MADLLAIDDVTAGYGEARVLDRVSLSMLEGDSVALLGRNGVGKTTLLTTLMGLTRVFAGRIRFRGEDFAHTPSHRRARAGIGWVPQERYVFPSLTVDEHLAKHEWLANDTLSLADLSVAATMNAPTAKLPVEPYRNLQGLLDRIHARPEWAATAQ